MPISRQQELDNRPSYVQSFINKRPSLYYINPIPVPFFIFFISCSVLRVSCYCSYYLLGVVFFESVSLMIIYCNSEQQFRHPPTDKSSKGTPYPTFGVGASIVIGLNHPLPRSRVTLGSCCWTMTVWDFPEPPPGGGAAPWGLS